MKDRVVLLALQIARIREEFSESEIQKAVRLLEEQGLGSSFLAYLGNQERVNTKPKIGRKAKSVEEQRSKAVIDLAQKDPEKYQVLSEFDSLVRKGSMLPSADDIRKFGESLSKSFSPRKSRRESIGKLMALLADRPLEEIRELLKVTLSAGKADEADGDYQRLAQFIISGKIPQSAREQMQLSV